MNFPPGGISRPQRLDTVAGPAARVDHAEARPWQDGQEVGQDEGER